MSRQNCHFGIYFFFGRIGTGFVIMSGDTETDVIPSEAEDSPPDVIPSEAEDRPPDVIPSEAEDRPPDVIPS